AHHLLAAGKSVALVDAFGPANSRASSGGESRVIRMGYGGDEIYTRWSLRSLGLWQEFFRRADRPLFHRVGVLWIARGEDRYMSETLLTLGKLKVPFERLSGTDLKKRYGQIAFGPDDWGLLEPESGALMARQAVQAVVEDAVRRGVAYQTDTVAGPTGRNRLESVRTIGGEFIHAGSFVFACGPWLPKLFPDLLEGRIHPTRQEVFFFGAPHGDRRFAPPSFPAWIDFGHEIYGIPDLENRGFKIALDRHGPAFDPDTGERTPTAENLQEVREFLGWRFPALKHAPVLEARVCQYENTSNGDFLIDRHPDFENVWLVGGGSGHGFKHGPALGEYVAARVVEGGAVEPRFALASKGKAEERAVY
ncbi:MAG: FAD-dependent oxidoreductase, partial [Acidobacteria bacterium]|nr:FAD-dependent oxidoreductase [Acidobacteriota bacterium]